MKQATYVQAGEMIDYRPSAALRAGDVVVLGGRVLVATQDIPAGKMGALATAGAFDVVKTGVGFVAGSPVHWSTTAVPIGGGSGAAVEDQADGVYLGYALASAVTDAPTVRVLLGAATVVTPRIVWDEAPEIIGGNHYRLAQLPLSGKLMLFRNGLLQREGTDNDFTLAGRDIAFNFGNEPQVGDILSATYLPA